MTLQTSTNNASAADRARLLAEKARARLAAISAEKQTAIAAAAAAVTKVATVSAADTEQLPFTLDASRDWNPEQRTAIISGLKGRSFVLTGAAGTGKTSTLKGLVASLINNNLLPILSPADGTKWLRAGTPGIALVSFTNMAVRQIAKHFSSDINICTIHKLLEFAPVFYEVDDPVTGLTKKTMRFEPTRNRLNPLPRRLRTIIVDESSMVDTDLIKLLEDALPDPSSVQWIFVGDINQLPPVYGGAILGRKLLELPVIDLCTVYRQALESPIISLATDIKNGKLVPVGTDKIVIDKGDQGKLTIHPWSKSIHWEDALLKAQNFLKAAIQAGEFNPYTDMALCPFNVSFGCIELNLAVADWLGRQRQADVYEVIAGFNKHYLAVGDKVLVNKREAIITNIAFNRDYNGKLPMSPRRYKIDRWGGATAINGAPVEADQDGVDVDALLASLVSSESGEVEDRKHAASHAITVRFFDGTDPATWSDTDPTDEYESTTLDTAAEINEMLFGYVCSVHKSQGSEWRRVFLLFHAKHSQMCSRELMYTAITRAAKQLYIICEPDRGGKSGTLSKAAKSPRLKGDTLAEKLASLRAKFEEESKGQIDEIN